MIVREPLEESLKGKDINFLRFNQMRLLIMHTSQLLRNTYEDLEEEFKIKGLYLQDIKHNLIQIGKKLKSYPQLDWFKFNDENSLAFAKDMDIFEDLAKGLVGLNNTQAYTFMLKYKLGSKVEINGVPAIVKSIEVRTIITEESYDEIIYTLDLDGKEIKLKENEIL